MCNLWEDLVVGCNYVKKLGFETAGIVIIGFCTD